MLKLEQLKYQQQPASAAGGSTRADVPLEQQLFELQLQKEQAAATAVRLKKQLAELFPTVPPGAAAAAADCAAAFGDGGMPSAAGSSRPATAGVSQQQLGSLLAFANEQTVGFT